MNIDKIMTGMGGLITGFFAFSFIQRHSSIHICNPPSYPISDPSVAENLSSHQQVGSRIPLSVFYTSEEKY